MTFPTHRFRSFRVDFKYPDKLKLRRLGFDECDYVNLLNEQQKTLAAVHNN
jgi:hypothetical protein